MANLARNRLYWLCLVTVFGVVGCQRQVPVPIEFAVTQIPQCNTGLTVKWYGYDFKLRTVAGEWVALQLPDAAPVQLVDMACGDEASTTSFPGKPAAKGPFAGLRFTVGVPPDLNHQDPAVAAPPLNRSDMFWVWQQGYKFLSIEGPAGPVLHLGSTGCSGPAPVRPPNGDCQRPNRLTVTIDEFDPADDRVGVALAPLLELLRSGDRCTGDYQASDNCREAIALLGLNLETGQCSADCGRVLFTRKAR